MANSSPWSRIEKRNIQSYLPQETPQHPRSKPSPHITPRNSLTLCGCVAVQGEIMDEPVCQGCGIPLSDDEVYACSDCADWWAMTGYDVERSREDENPESP